MMLGFYLYFCPMLNPSLYSLIIFHPEKKLDGPYKIKEVDGHAYQDVFFPSLSGPKLHGWYFDIPGAKYTFLFHHGNGANLASRVEELKLLLGTGSSVLTFDYEGYGRSEGEPSMTVVRDDAMAAYRYLTEQKHTPPDHILFFGESLGTAIAANLSTRVKPAGIVLQCPLAGIRRRGSEIARASGIPVVQMYPACMWPESGFDTIAAFTGKHPPLLIIAGTEDTMIPIAHADDLFRLASEPKEYVRINGAGHTGDAKLTGAPEYRAELRKFVSNLSAQDSDALNPKN